MKQTLIEIQGYLKRVATEGREPSPAEVATIIRRRLEDSEDEDRYWRGLGDFVGQALGGAIIIPERWTPPD